MSQLSINRGPEAMIRCPACGVESACEMPSDACVHFWECPACQRVSTPKQGDCCVICSYGDRNCPPRQRQGQ